MYNAHVALYWEHLKLHNHSIQESLCSLEFKLFGKTKHVPFQFSLWSN